MKTGLSFCTLCALLFAGLSLPIKVLSQDAEKQKIIDVITGELDAWYKRTVQNGDLEKRIRLQKRMDETLGWTGLGHCDGGSIGSGSMEVCCLVVEFEAAKEIIEKDLADTEFSDYIRVIEETGE